jgi:hypothetical protein
MNKFKVGDIIVNTSGDYSITSSKINFIGEIVQINQQSTVDIEVKVVSTDEGKWIGQTFWVSSKDFSLKSGKLPKPKPIDNHVVIKDSCGNFVGIKNSYKEAEELAKGSDGNMTIYKMTEVAKVTNERIVKKVTLKK